MCTSPFPHFPLKFFLSVYFSLSCTKETCAETGCKAAVTATRAASATIERGKTAEAGEETKDATAAVATAAVSASVGAAIAKTGDAAA